MKILFLMLGMTLISCSKPVSIDGIVIDISKADSSTQKDMRLFFSDYFSEYNNKEDFCSYFTSHADDMKGTYNTKFKTYLTKLERVNFESTMWFHKNFEHFMYSTDKKCNMNHT